MAGKTVPIIYCWELQLEGLNIYLASTLKGALQVGLSLEKKGDCMGFFKRRFPDAELHKDKGKNRLLIQGIEAAFMNRFTGPPRLDVHLTPFQKKVLHAIAHIPFGETRTYGAVAAKVGSPNGARAIGQVMKRNPVPIIFP